MWHQLLFIWQNTFVAGYPLGVLIMAFQIGCLLAIGSLWYHSTRDGTIYRDELIMIPVWIVGTAVGMLIYKETSMWPGFLALLLIGSGLFAYWSLR